MEDLSDISPNPMAAEKSIGKKRKRSVSSHDEDDQPAEKYLELAEVFTLDRFSDEVLFEIFQHLDTFTLLALEKTCTRFYGLVQDHRLWNDIDLLAEEKTIGELKHVLEKAQKKTKSVKINELVSKKERSKGQGECVLRYVIPKCEILADLELQNVYVDFFAIKIQDFPKLLKRLVFRNVSVRWPDNAPTVFQKMDRTLIWLEELRVEYCTWFHPYDIMLFSKCPSLKKLSMQGCKNLTDFVPYGSMASRFGFKTLEYLDVRDTPITDSDLQCFNAILTLKELLLECPVELRAKAPETASSSSPAPSSSFAFASSPSTSSSRKDPIAGSSSDSSNSSSTSDSSSDSSEPASSSANDGEPSTSGQRRNHNALSNVMMTIDLQNHTRTVILHGRVCEIPEAECRRIPLPDNGQGNFGNLLRHPHFWGMIDRQTGPDCGPSISTKAQTCPITNRGISCFGRPANPIDQNVIWIRIGHRPSDNTFERLSLRHYKRVTDDSLKHLVQCSPKLIFLDVSGTGVTQEGVDEFKIKKPECEVVCGHLEEPQDF